MRINPKKIVLSLLKPEIFFLLIAFLIVQLWFSKNLLFGGTEVGVPTFTPSRILDQIKWTWWEALGPGVSIPTVPASIPFYFFLAVLERIGLGAILIQKILFFILIYLQGLGACLIFRTILPNKGKLQILAGLLYIFNPYMMTYIWHRFIYTNFILSAVLPLLIYFYLKLLEKENLKYIFYFLVTSFMASYMFSAIAPAMAVWLSLLPLYLTAVVINRFDFKKIYRITFLSLILLFFWIATNLWWIYPLSLNKGIFSFFSTQSNVEVLITLSEKSTINTVVRGINPYNMFIEKDWGEIYQNTIFQFLSWIPFLFFLFGLLQSIKLNKAWFMIILFIFGAFLAKGSAEPLGFINSWLYSQIFILGAIKNPIEKLGLLIFLPISIITAFGISSFWELYKKIYFRVLVLTLIVGCIIYVWPMWSDQVFGSAKYPPFFKLPDDYKESSILLAKEMEKDDGKILHLPIGEGDSTTYIWSHIYNGADLANHLFPGVSISRFSYIPFVDSMLYDTARIFHTDNYQLYDQAITNLGVRYIVLNKDIDWYFRDVDNPKFIEDKLDKFNKLTVLKDTDHLKIYKYTSKVEEEVSIPQKITSYSAAGNSISNSLDFMWEGSSTGDRSYLEVSPEDVSPDSADQKILLPKRTIIDRAEQRNSQDFIPPTYYEKYLPGSLLYPLISISEKIETILTPSYSKPVRVLLLTTKRLRETQRFREQDKRDLFTKSVDTYSQYLKESLNLFNSLESEKINDERLYLSKYILKQESKDLENLLEYPKDDDTKRLIENDLEKIDEFNKRRGFTLIYPTNNAPVFTNKDSYSFQFSIKEQFRGNPIIAVSDLDYFGSLDKGKLSFYIDGKEKQIILKKIDGLDWFDFGEVILDPGEHEITIPISNDNNLLANNSSLQQTKGLVEAIDGNNLRINSSTDGAWIDYKISGYNPTEKYLISFYHRIIKGTAPMVDILQEKDSFNSPYNDKEIKTKDLAQADSYNFDWRYFQTSFGKDKDVTMKVARSTIQPIVRIKVPVWNNCEYNNLKNLKLCENEDYKKRYDKPSIVEFRDIKITKLLNAQLFLKSSQNLSQTKKPKLKVNKISPTEYNVEIDATGPNFPIIFNEGFHPGWKVEIDDGKTVQTVEENNHYLANGYANGWLINQSGKLTLKIKFMPQNYLRIGVIMSIIACIALTSLIVGKKFSKSKTNK